MAIRRHDARRARKKHSKKARTKSGKPRKGVMPPALKKYWATHKR